MVNLTLAIPEDLHEKMKEHSEIRWSEVVRKSIAEKIEDLELMEHLVKKSRFTEKDLEQISHKINREVFEELEKHESHS